MFTLQQLNTQAKTAITLFLLFILTATISSVILLGLELTGKKAGFNLPTISQIQSKYTTPAIVAAMRGSMFKHVTEEEDIDLVAQWIKNGAKKEDPLFVTVARNIKLDCTNCHSKTSTMTKAIPSIPLETYKQILEHIEAGYSWSKMSKQAHIHMFGIAMFLIVLTLLFSYTSYNNCIKNTLILTSYGGSFLDIFSWWFSKYYAGLVYLIYGMGGLMVGSILLMSVLILADIWKNASSVSVSC